LLFNQNINQSVIQTLSNQSINQSVFLLCSQLLDVAAINLVKGNAPYTPAHLAVSELDSHTLNNIIGCFPFADIIDFKKED